MAPCPLLTLPVSGPQAPGRLERENVGAGCGLFHVSWGGSGSPSVMWGNEGLVTAGVRQSHSKDVGGPASAKRGDSFPGPATAQLTSGFSDPSCALPLASPVEGPWPTLLCTPTREC